jgi:hypothetical protein
VTKDEEEGNMVLSLGVEKRNRGESLILKKFVSLMSNFEEVTNWVPNVDRPSNWVPNFQISREIQTKKVKSFACSERFDSAKRAKGFWVQVWGVVRTRTGEKSTQMDPAIHWRSNGSRKSDREKLKNQAFEL